MTIIRKCITSKSSTVCRVLSLNLMILAGLLVHSSVIAGNPFEMLRLQDAITRALQDNYEIEIERINPEVAGERIMIAESAFDITLEASYLYESKETPQNARDFASLFGSNQPVETNIYDERNQTTNIGLVKKFALGTVAELRTTQRILDNDTNSNGSLYHPEYESYTFFKVTQPLLQGFGFDANLAEIRIARSNQKSADLEWQARTANLVGQVMNRYYDVTYAYENMQIQADAIDLAEQLLEENRKRSAEGVIPPNDVYLAEAAVFKRREEALLAEAEYMQRQNGLQLLFKTVELASEVVDVKPADSLSDKVTYPSRTELLEHAWSHRYDLLKAKETVAQRGYQTDYARNAVKPQLNLIGSTGMRGLEGDIDGSYSEAADGQGPEWTVGVEFSMPLSFERQKARARLAEREEAKSEIDVKRLKQQISLEIDTVLSRLKIDQQRVETARMTSEVALKTLDAENKRLEEGLTTSYQVLVYQKEYSQTLSRVVAALADLNKGLVDLWLTTSQLLERQRIVVADGGDRYHFAESLEN